MTAAVHEGSDGLGIMEVGENARIIMKGAVKGEASIQKYILLL